MMVNSPITNVYHVFCQAIRLYPVSRVMTIIEAQGMNKPNRSSLLRLLCISTTKRLLILVCSLMSLHLDGIRFNMYILHNFSIIITDSK